LQRDCVTDENECAYVQEKRGLLRRLMNEVRSHQRDPVILAAIWGCVRNLSANRMSLSLSLCVCVCVCVCVRVVATESGEIEDNKEAFGRLEAMELAAANLRDHPNDEYLHTEVIGAVRNLSVAGMSISNDNDNNDLAMAITVYGVCAENLENTAVRIGMLDLIKLQLTKFAHNAELISQSLLALSHCIHARMSHWQQLCGQSVPGIG
jgi:hypothetical protein